MRSFRTPPKYSCTICGKMFKRKKQHFNHVMRNSCGKNKKSTKNQIIIPQIEPELVSVKDEFIHNNPQTTTYFGAEYNNINIPTGNRHLRTGIPFPSDPLRRK